MRPIGESVGTLGLTQSTTAEALTAAPDVDRALTRVSHPQADCASHFFLQVRTAPLALSG
jgi:hypothetical protein